MTYKCIISSNCSDPREYEVQTKSAMKAAADLGRCEGGETVEIRTKRSNRIISSVSWTPEDGGHYFRTYTPD